MHNELTNLLPHERQHALSRDYVIRFATVAVLMTTALIIAAAVLLIPSYIFLMQNENTKTSRLANIESTLSSADEQNLSARLEALSADAAALTSLEHSPSASLTVREILAISRPGIALSGLSYTAAADKKSSTLVINGVAATRDALRSYQIALQSAPFALSADLPVSAYAQDSQIAFTITITLAP